MPSLIIRSRSGKRTVVELGSRPIKLGRGDSCDVVLHDDGEVSREHAEVWLDEHGRVLVADTNSKNGTRVDEGDPFRGATRVATRTIRVGEHDIEITGAPASPPRAPERVEFQPDSPRSLGDTKFFPSSKRLDLNQQRLGLLISLTERIGGTFERKQLLEQALDACCEALGFERGLIALKTQRGDPELPVTRNVQRDEHGAYKISRTLINRALIHGERAVVNNPATDLMNNLSESLIRFPICSALCVPILHDAEVLGVVYGDRVTAASTYSPEDVDFFAAIAQQVGVGLVNQRLAHEFARSQRIYAELEQARTIQRGLLPSAPLRSGRVLVEGHNEPSSAVGGDYFDYFELGDGRLGFIIGDVTGHGLPAALLMANLQAAVRVALTGDVRLSELTTRVNRLICANTAQHVFITAVLGTVDSRTGDVHYVCAGHPPPLCLGKQVRIPAHDNSLPLGVDPEEQFEVHRLPGDDLHALLFYTDGLTEASTIEGSVLTLDAVLAAMGQQRDRTPAALIQQARTLVRRHLDGAPNLDDMTLMAMQIL